MVLSCVIVVILGTDLQVRMRKCSCTQVFIIQENKCSYFYIVFIHFSALETAQLLHQCLQTWCNSGSRCRKMLCSSLWCWYLLCLGGLEHFLQWVNLSGLCFHCEHENLSFSESTKKWDVFYLLSLAKENFLCVIISLETGEMAECVSLLTIQS